MKLRFWTILATICLLSACGSVDPPTLGTTRGAIVGGEVDETTRGVVGLGVGINLYFFGHCTGTLIAPNLVLTARHCVALVSSPTEYGSVICGETPFSLHGPGALFYASAETVRPHDIGPTYYQGTGSVFAEKEANDICGYDIALIMLEGEGIPASVATPIEPRIEEPAVTGELFSAVGYGYTEPEGINSGTRMRIDNRKVVCTVGTCTALVKQGEFGSDAPVCSGDSGGPALDEQGRVFGVVSRGPDGCDSSVYGDVAGHKDLIIRAALAAAKSGGYPLPDWAQPYATEDGGPDGNGADGGASVEAGTDSFAPQDAGEADTGGTNGNGGDGGCTLAAGRASRTSDLISSIAVLLGVALLILLRRRCGR